MPVSFRTVLAAASASAIALAGTAASAQGRAARADAGGPRVAAKALQEKVAREVKRGFRRWFGPPSSVEGKRLKVVLFPICVSAADPRFLFVVADPVQPSGVVGQPGYLYLHRSGDRMQVVGGLLTGDRALHRPAGVPLRVHREMGLGSNASPCTFRGRRAVRQALAQQLAPWFWS